VRIHEPRHEGYIPQIVRSGGRMAMKREHATRRVDFDGATVEWRI
jgi:hypothetical protein